MKSKYTVIYTERWMSGSQYHAMTKMMRVEIDCGDKNIMNQLHELVGTTDIQYIFEGWPLLQGEKV